MRVAMSLRKGLSYFAIETIIFLFTIAGDHDLSRANTSATETENFVQNSG